VFGSRRKVINVHGCFWHQHPRAECYDSHRPASNTGYWSEKLARNVARDAENHAKLEEMGWTELVVWECEMRDHDALLARLRQFLDGCDPVMP
jgi:DNA mismatch endonuclease (patch repair protein)